MTRPDDEKREEPTFWCNTHQRPALNEKYCDPNLGGILLPCSVVNLTGEAEIVRSRSTSGGTGEEKE